jgi:hypothetical protein
MDFRVIGILALVASLIGGFAGWEVRGWKADSDIATIKDEFQARIDEQREAKEMALASLEAASRNAAAGLEKQKQLNTDKSFKIKSEVLHEKANALNSSVPVCAISPEWVRIYNEALRPASDSPEASGESIATTEGTGLSGAGIAGTDQWEVLWIHAENSARWNECRAQLNALIDYEMAPVVTAESTEK